MSDLNTLCLTVKLDVKRSDNEYYAWHESRDIEVPVVLCLYSQIMLDAFEQYQKGDLLMVTGELFMPQERNHARVVVYQVTKQENEATFNSLTVTGRLGRDPEIKYFEDGTAVANSSLAVNGYANGKTTTWLNIRAFKPANSSGAAEVLMNYCKKGQQVGITGKLTFARSTSGMEYYPDLNIVRLVLLGSKNSTPTASALNPNDFCF